MKKLYDLRKVKDRKKAGIECPHCKKIVKTDKDWDYRMGVCQECSDHEYNVTRGGLT